MGRPPSNGGPAFRFVQSEVTEMEAILQQYNNTMPSREVLMALADKFSESPERKGKITVQMKQVWNWFQNRRYAIRAKSSKVLGKLDVSPMSRDDLAAARNVPQGPQQIAAPVHVPSVPGSGKGAPENAIFEFEAKSGRDGAWYDVANFLSHKNLETGNPEVLVRFAGFGPEEDEWVTVRKHVRQRSLPCESSECVAVLPGDLILCFQEGKEHALYFDAHVLDAQRRRHDVRGCRCRFLVRYVHDQSEEIVPLRKVCRRPETDYRLQQLHAVNEAISAEQKSMEQYMASATSGEMMQKQQNAVPPTFHVTASLPTQTTTPEL
ncbi:protein SAWADEE HOMEODOMAIN HOMOLOG 2 isoform X1 [Pyrus x bretschneideri]|uniref:protein SAWADEE HOMEODOMAIN HOMOLOG 2 isoform X1 n=1 Tax=Pyrus x bretschneideri TaxID=225117 RepID=UPI0020304974|nr:protein SAWADEE HOMEODOMAIN HOMOLOG 2 isoform X1 [Pyrus x bretschneideri]